MRIRRAQGWYWYVYENGLSGFWLKVLNPLDKVRVTELGALQSDGSWTFEKLASIINVDLYIVVWHNLVVAHRPFGMYPS